jgi:hypothetical protein
MLTLGFQQILSTACPESTFKGRMTSDTSVLRVFAGHCEAFIPAEPGWTPKQSHAVFGLRKPFTDEIASAFVPPLAGRRPRNDHSHHRRK